MIWLSRPLQYHAREGFGCLGVCVGSSWARRGAWFLELPRHRIFLFIVVLGYRPFFERCAAVHAEAFSLTARGSALVPYEPLVQWLTARRMRDLASDGGFFTTAVALRYSAHGFSRDVRVHATEPTTRCFGEWYATTFRPTPLAISLCRSMGRGRHLTRGHVE